MRDDVWMAVMEIIGKGMGWISERNRGLLLIEDGYRCAGKWKKQLIPINEL